MECILDWVKYTNACPLCKVTIKHLKVFDEVDPDKVSHLQEVPEPKQARGDDGELLDDEEVVFAEVCYICKVTKTLEEEEAMLVCDECDYEIAHPQCLNLP